MNLAQARLLGQMLNPYIRKKHNIYIHDLKLRNHGHDNERLPTLKQALIKQAISLSLSIYIYISERLGSCQTSRPIYRIRTRILPIIKWLELGQASDVAPFKGLNKVKDPST
eukprot:TRINITY_DN27197_c1_g1_i1.p1 TRINITY_DN27197_c1_g1~~TRINITY_DN27197_c1_g1_i1.p1  ORF type:complete len:112 (+),score=9.71 TRINITY_DN27197_c1_g1_i1:519-854(+)